MFNGCKVEWRAPSVESLVCAARVDVRAKAARLISTCPAALVRDDRTPTREGRDDSTMADELIRLVDDRATVKAATRIHHTEMMTRPRMATEQLHPHGVGGHRRDLEPTAIDSCRRRTARARRVRAHDVSCSQHCRLAVPRRRRRRDHTRRTGRCGSVRTKHRGEEIGSSQRHRHSRRVEKERNQKQGYHVAHCRQTSPGLIDILDCRESLQRLSMMSLPAHCNRAVLRRLGVASLRFLRVGEPRVQPSDIASFSTNLPFGNADGFPKHGVGGGVMPLAHEQ